MLKEEFIEYLRLERNFSPHTQSVYGRDLTLFETYFKSLDASLDFLSVDSHVVRNWVMHLMDSNYKPSSVNRKLSTLRSFYRFLVMKGYTESSPVASIRGPKKAKPLPHFVRDSEMEELLNSTDLGDGYKGLLCRTIIDCFYETGIRLAELIGLDDNQVDLDACLMKVTGKRNKQRIIPIGSSLKRSLSDYYDERCAVFGPGGGKTPFFMNEKGERIARHRVYRMVKSALALVSNVEKKSPHVLRHTFATSMLNNNADLGAVKELLGHSSLSTTEIYTHATLKELSQIYSKAHPHNKDK